MRCVASSAAPPPPGSGGAPGTVIDVTSTAPSHRVVSVSRTIAADPSTIFELLDDPARHPDFDGSGTVLSSRAGSRHLQLGDRFGMDMRMGMPYRMTNTVVEYERDRLIAWAHQGGHRWRYELTPVDGGTEVTESFDWSTAKIPPFIELIGAPKRNAEAMRRSLERLAALLEQPGA